MDGEPCRTALDYPRAEWLSSLPLCPTLLSYHSQRGQQWPETGVQPCGSCATLRTGPGQPPYW
jgi:hypothetical protein